MMQSDTILNIFSQLQYERDSRRPPDDLRKGRFRTGWEDASIRGFEYSAETLRRLTWQNLGYRFGKHLGVRAVDDIDEVYNILAASYRASVSADSAHVVEETDKMGGTIVDWHAEIRRDPHALRADEASASDPCDAEGYRPDGVDRRPLIARQIRERGGQREFRDALLQRYGGRCLVTDCSVLAVLEAAHISPYRGQRDHHPENGLLLRSDIHTLFDLDLLGIEPGSLRVELSPEVMDEYGCFAGTSLVCPSDRRPSLDALRLRYQQFRSTF